MDEPVKGSCMDIEKDYFRLNEAPDPSSVRPPAVLRKSLENVKRCVRARQWPGCVTIAW